MGIIRPTIKSILKPTLNPVLRGISGNREPLLLRSSDGLLIQSSDSKILAVR